ncbi:hypothetical protein [Pseudomonas putida]|uniref:Uncharacterized protein n=1 Tax=Pseudomonas putida TaxID=303 RepID=A0A7V8J5L2_PSEPU|nr:hypothetical protein [Pseudomonas putida]KAF0255650.1 hypothetical protein GN299_06050 [Pseudomonas putida]
MDDQIDTSDFAVELQRLRDAIPVAVSQGAATTTISIEVLTRLLKRYDTPHEGSTELTALCITQEDVEHLLHAHTELTRVAQSPRRIRHPLAKQLTRILAPALANMSGRKPAG